MWRPLLLLFALALSSDALASDNDLSNADLREIKRVCKSLIGVRAWGHDADPIFDRLKPYLKKGASLRESRIVTCSAACGGTVPLRGDAEVYYAFPNTPGGLSGAGQDHFDTVVLHVRGKRIFAIGPGTEYYPYPYYEEEHKKR